EGMLLHNFGFEGRHYSKNEQGLVAQTNEGMQAVTDYATTGIGAFWPFANVSWSNSVKQPSTELTGQDGLVAISVQSAFGKSPHTFIYDLSPFILPTDFIPSGSEMFNDQERINVYKESQIAKIVIANDDAEFSRLYGEMIAKIKELGIEAIDATINAQVQKQMKDGGIDLKGVNS
ncbi:hypothetical protein AB4Z21_34970, partial [Paenibacillus sp. MCAF20]